jgi:T5SS/PEP-CTERM-associated repeat protein
MKESSDQCTPFFLRGVVVAAVLFIIWPMLMNATDLNRAPANKLNRGLNADSFRMVFPKNYVELPLGQTVWVDGTGDWFNPLNWSAGVPNSGTIAQINNGGTAEITLGGAAASQVELGIAAGDAGTLSTSGSGSLQDEGAMYVGEQGTGTLSITAGASISSSLFALGQSPGSSGTATVSGPGSTWTNSVFCFVGSDGMGTLNISNGGSVTASDTGVGAGVGSGIVVVDGTGSTWSNDGTIVVGGNANGMGAVTISNGGTVFTGGGGGTFGSVIGYNSGSTGTVNVSGANSIWTNAGPLGLSGAGGDGTLHIMGGGVVSNSNSVLGSISGGNSTVTVDGIGSTWTNNGDLFVGALEGSGMVMITGSGVVSNINGFIAFGDEMHQPTGSVDVDGAASIWTNSGDLYVGGSESGAGGNGTLHVNGGGTVSAGRVTVWSPGTIGGSGIIQAANGITVEGALAPEETLSINGNLALTSDAITLSTVTPDAADDANVEGTATLDGELQVVVTGGPYTVGAQYTLLQATGGLNGTTFANVSITAPPGVKSQVTYDANHVYLIIKSNGSPTPTPTPSATPTPTPTPTATATPTVSPTPCKGRCSPTPRPRPTPAPRP